MNCPTPRYEVRVVLHSPSETAIVRTHSRPRCDAGMLYISAVCEEIGYPLCRVLDCRVTLAPDDLSTMTLNMPM